MLQKSLYYHLRNTNSSKLEFEILYFKLKQNLKPFKINLFNCN